MMLRLLALALAALAVSQAFVVPAPMRQQGAAVSARPQRQQGKALVVGRSSQQGLVKCVRSID